MNTTLKNIMVKGLKWAGFSQIFRFLFQFVIITILARILLPADLGIVSIAMIFTNLFVVFNELGLTLAIIQKKDIKDIHLIVSFWTCVMISVFFFLLILGFAPLASTFFHKEIVGPIMIILGLKFIVESLGFVSGAMLKREVLFKRLAFIDAMEMVFYGSVAIIFALHGFGAFSIALGYLVGSLVRVFLLRIFSPIPVSLKFDKACFLELFHYGKHITGFRIASYFLGNFDYFIVGKFLGAAALGYYTLAFNISNFPREKLSSVVNNVAFPVFSKMQEDKDQMSATYLKMVRYVSCVTFPLLVGLMVICPLFVRVVLTEKWLPMVVPLQLLCIGGIFFSITTFVGVIFNSTGHPDYSLKFSIIGIPVISIAVLAGLKYGLVGIALGVSVYAACMNIVGQIMTGRILKMSSVEYFRAIMPAVSSSFVMALGLSGLLALEGNFAGMPEVLLLAFSVALGLLFYLSSLFLINRQVFRESMVLLKRMALS